MSTGIMIIGPSGSGKTTLGKIVASFFAGKTKLFLAQTNPAVDNLKRKVKVADCEYMTIAKFLSRERFVPRKMSTVAFIVFWN